MEDTTSFTSKFLLQIIKSRSGGDRQKFESLLKDACSSLQQCLTNIENTRAASRIKSALQETSFTQKFIDQLLISVESNPMTCRPWLKVTFLTQFTWVGLEAPHKGRHRIYTGFEGNDTAWEGDVMRFQRFNGNGKGNKAIQWLAQQMDMEYDDVSVFIYHLWQQHPLLPEPNIIDELTWEWRKPCNHAVSVNFAASSMTLETALAILKAEGYKRLEHDDFEHNEKHRYALVNVPDQSTVPDALRYCDLGYFLNGFDTEEELIGFLGVLGCGGLFVTLAVFDNGKPYALTHSRDAYLWPGAMPIMH